jgi:hypothetical protein
MSQKPPMPPRPGSAPPRPFAPGRPPGGPKGGAPDAEAAPGSSTQFFAIPAKKKSKEPEAPPAPPKPEPATAGRALPSGPPRSIAPVAQPVAQGGNPFVVAGPVPMGGIAPEESRAESMRVFAIVLALVSLAAMVLMVAVAAILFGAWRYTEAEVATVAQNAGEDGVKDTGDQDPLVIERKVKTTPRASTTTTTAATAPVEAPPAFAPLTVTVPADYKVTYVEVTDCGVRERAEFGGKTTATIQKVPTDKDCKLFFRGGEPAQFNKVRGGMTLSCTFKSTTAVCK